MTLFIFIFSNVSVICFCNCE